MQGLLHRASLTADAIDVQPALFSDRAAIYALTENTHRVHFNLDWWTFDNWLYPDRPSDTIWLARFNNELIGLLLAPFDGSPSVWLRSLAIADGYSADPVFAVLLKQALASAESLGAQRVTALAHPDWLLDLLRRSGFTPYNEVVTFRKSDRELPGAARTFAHPAKIRLAVPEDIPTITRNDRTAFDTAWWHSPESIGHILKTVSHFVVAEIDGRVVGHAFSDLYGGQGHLIRLVVHPVYQRRGIGEQLLLESLRYQIHSGAYPFTLNTQADNVTSQRLYRRYGYLPIGRPVRVVQKAIVNE